MSPELETLDQLLGGKMPLKVLRQLYPDNPAFQRGIMSLLKCGDVRLIGDEPEITAWRWSSILSDEATNLLLEITLQGTRRVS